MSEVRDWLDFLYKGSPGYFCLTAFGGGRPKVSKWYDTEPSSLDRAARTIERYANTYDLYVSVATHREPGQGSSRGGYKTVTSIPGFWADIDIGTAGHKPAALPNPETVEEALSIIEGLPEPTAVVHSGGGLQVWWKFDEPWVFDDPKDAQIASEDWQRLLVQRGASRGYHVDAVGDLPRILRLPGTANHKLPEVRSVTRYPAPNVSGVLYPVDVVRALGIPEELTGEEPTEDTFPLSWEDILSPHGYTFAGTDSSSGGLRVVRPGKTASQGISGIASPYGIPVLVNHSASDPILPSGPGKKLTKLRVYALLNCKGDMKAAQAAISRMRDDTPELLAEIAARFVHTRINWPTLWEEEDIEPEWYCEPIIEAGRLIAVYSEGKVGKSLLMLEIAMALATGRSVLGNPAREPIRVLYIDRENLKKDIRERGENMGFKGEELPNLFYYSFPQLSWLDTEAGGHELYALASYHQAQLVIIDTLSRVVTGMENESNTYLDFYNYTGMRIKAAGIALLRLDHSGKDDSKGMRGSSSKEQDVDEIWQMKREVGSEIIEMTRTHSRTNHGAGTLILARRDEPLLHHAVIEDKQEQAMWKEMNV